MKSIDCERYSELHIPVASLEGHQLHLIPGYQRYATPVQCVLWYPIRRECCHQEFGYRDRHHFLHQDSWERERHCGFHQDPSGFQLLSESVTEASNLGYKLTKYESQSKGMILPRDKQDKFFGQRRALHAARPTRMDAMRNESSMVITSRQARQTSETIRMKAIHHDGKDQTFGWPKGKQKGKDTYQ